MSVLDTSGAEAVPALNTADNSQRSLKEADLMVLPWDRFSYWLKAILVVTFDIEMGQSLEVSAQICGPEVCPVPNICPTMYVFSSV